MTKLSEDLAPGMTAHEAYDQAQVERITALEAALEDCENNTPPPTVTPTKTWIVGMKTESDEWDERVAGLLPAPINGRRLFKSSWDVDGMVNIAQQCHNGGHFPYISAKMSPSSWSQVAAGALDTEAEELAQRLANLGYPIRVTFHHEPRGGGVDTPAELVPWADALTRLFTVMRGAVDDEHERLLILGPCDNGHPWGQEWGTQTDAQLDTYYKQGLLDVCDVMGADFYDGATDTNDGEPAWIKMDHFAQYMNRRGFEGVNDPGWKYDAGEWNFVKASDCDDTLTFLLSDAGKDFNCLNLFNSAENNRDDLPTELNGSWELVPGTDRHQAYQNFCTALVGDTRTVSGGMYHARPRVLEVGERFGTGTGATVSNPPARDQRWELLQLAARFDTRALSALLRSDLPLATAWAKAAEELRQNISNNEHPLEPRCRVVIVPHPAPATTRSGVNTARPHTIAHHAPKKILPKKIRRSPGYVGKSF